MKPSLALAIITRGNDYDGIVRLLDQVKPYVDCISACVDTRDGISVLRPLWDAGAFVDTAPFDMWTPRCINFAANRNRSLDIAKNSGATYALILDSDEELLDGAHIPACVAYAHEHDIDLVSIALETCIEGRASSLEEQPRIVRLDKVRYHFPVHTQPVGGKLGMSVPSIRVRAHYPADLRGRVARSFPGLAKLWRTGDDREKAHAAFYMARMLGAIGRWRPCLRWAREAAQREPERFGHLFAQRLAVIACAQIYGPWRAFLEAVAAVEDRPNIMDYWHEVLRMAFVLWRNASNDPANAVLTQAQSRQFLPNSQQVSDLMGFELEIDK